MVSSQAELYIKIVQLSIIFIITSYFVFRRVKDKIIGFNWFIFIFGMAIVQSIIELALYFPMKNNPEAFENISSIQEIHIIPYAAGLFGLFLYCELIRNAKPNTLFLGITTALLGGYIAIYFIELGLNLQSAYPPEYRFSRFVFSIFQALVLAEALYTFIQDAIKVEHKKLRNLSIFISVAFSIAFLSALYKIVEQATYLITKTEPVFQIYGAIPFSLTFGIMAIVFIFNPFYVYLLPTVLNKVIVINDAGILFYSVNIGKDCPDDECEDELFSGIVAALKSFLEDTTGSTSDLRKISFRDKKMIIAENKEKKVSTIILGDSDSFILNTAAKQFTNAFCEKFAKHIDSFDGTVDIFEEATSIVKRIFPFVPPEEIIEAK